MNFRLLGNRVNPLFSNTFVSAPHVVSFKPVNNCDMNASFFDKHSIRLIQAPMAGSQNHRLAAAVFLAGGLGSMPAAMLTAKQLQDELSAFKDAIAAEKAKANAKAIQWGVFLPVNVNFFCHTPPAEQLEKEAAWRQQLTPLYQAHGIDPQSVGSGLGRAPFSEESLKLMGQFKPAVVSFHFGLPRAEWVQQLKSWGIQIWSSATTDCGGRYFHCSCRQRRQGFGRQRSSSGHRFFNQRRSHHQRIASPSPHVRRGKAHRFNQPVQWQASTRHCEQIHARLWPPQPKGPRLSTGHRSRRAFARCGRSQRAERLFALVVWPKRIRLPSLACRRHRSQTLARLDLRWLVFHLATAQC